MHNSCNELQEMSDADIDRELGIARAFNADAWKHFSYGGNNIRLEALNTYGCEMVDLHKEEIQILPDVSLSGVTPEYLKAEFTKEVLTVSDHDVSACVYWLSNHCLSIHCELAGPKHIQVRIHYVEQDI